MISDDQLRAIMPAVPVAKRTLMVPFLQTAIAEFEIDTPARTAAFVAQLAHESGQLRFMEEIWGPTAAQERYEPMSDLATRLGNTEPGDGKRFKGRGPIQVTGRANYKRFGDLLGVDLLADPAQAARPELGFRIAGLYWSKKGLNALADQVTDDAFREITRRINGGFNGLEDRRRFYEVACSVLDVMMPETLSGEPSAMPDEPVFDRGFEVIRILPIEIEAAGPVARRAARARKRKPRAVRSKKTPRAKKKTARRASARKTSRKRRPARRTRAGGKQR